MKLKKIASLALAGVMAVSMLAGCATKNDSNSGTTQVTSTGTVATFQNALKSYNPDLKITVKENSAVGTALKADDSTKDLTYKDLKSSVSAVETVVSKLYTGQNVTPTKVNNIGMTASAYDSFATSMKLTAVPTDSTKDAVAYGVAFLTTKVANTTELNMMANAFAESLANNKVKNTYEDLGADKTDCTAEYTLELYTVDVNDPYGLTGTLLVMAVHSQFAKVEA